MSGNVGYFDDGTTYDPDYVAWWWSRQRPRGTEDYRLHAYLQRSPGSGLSGGGAHDMSKPLGSQPPPPGTTLYVQQPQGGAPPPGQQGPPPQQCAPPQGQQGPPQGPQHLAGTLQQGMAFYSRQAQQVQQGPPQQPNPQAAPQQVQGQCPPQQVGGNQGRGGGGLGRPPPMGLSAAPGGGGPPPPGSVGQAPANYQPSIINFAPSQAAYPTQHITPMGILNCMNIQAFPTQRTSQFNTTTAQYVYPQYLPQQHMPQPHQAVYYASPAIGPMPMVPPPQAQAPRGQHTSPQGSQPLQPRQKRVLAICDPNTGRSIFDDAETPAAESSPAATPEQQQSSSSTSDIPGTFAAQVAATLVDAPAPSKSPVAPAPPPPAAAVLEPPQAKSNERVAEWVAAAAAATTAPSPAERQGSPPAEEERVAAPTAPKETAAVPAVEEEEEVEVAPVAVEVGEVRNGEGRTPVVVEEGARRAGDWEPERTAAATAAALEASREAADGEFPFAALEGDPRTVSVESFES
ncbi:hypothetical protein HPB47_020155 [Ixodes persulcatus]|uniref:Uncharacterized protein n=1 Tax=Ixodes persulcatus TaxID=34615 RepID=A0AC60QGA4_IXOPE|nr:hypothetical protein HPB47_020155 [Ixodes persulcatus]